MKKLVKSEEKRSMIPAALEQVTIRVLGGLDNHYTTENTLVGKLHLTMQ